MKHKLSLLRFCQLLFAVCFLPFAAQADPWDCMSQAEAEALVDFLKKNPFIIDYCDCCHDVEMEENGKSSVVATLLHVTGTEIIPCEYDPKRVSVKILYYVMSESTVDKEGELKTTDPNNPKFSHPFILISLNYHFTTTDNTNLRIFEAMNWLDYKNIECKGLLGFPNPAEFNDPVGKKYQKWATKRGNYWE